MTGPSCEGALTHWTAGSSVELSANLGEFLSPTLLMIIHYNLVEALLDTIRFDVVVV